MQPPKLRRSADSSTDNIILVKASSLDRGNFPQVYDFDTVVRSDTENDRDSVRNDYSDILLSYSTEKPHNFSLEASPVKKENSSVNSLECPFNANIKLGLADEVSTAESRHVDFETLFQHSDSSAILGISRLIAKNGAQVLAPSNLHASSITERNIQTAGHAIANAALIRQIELLNNRIALLEQVVRRMENNISNPAQISVSASSNESHLDDGRAQDVSFTIDYAYGSSVREEITCNDDFHNDFLDQRKHAKFHISRWFQSWFYLARSGWSKRKTSPVDV